MTVSSSARRAGPFLGNGAASAFSFNFKVFAASDIAVYITDPSGVQTPTTNIFVVVNPDQDASPGGTVNYPLLGGVFLPAGWKLDIVGAVDYTQGTDLTNLGRFLPDVIEKALDRLTILAQQLREWLGRTVSFPVGDTGSATLPAAAARANKALIFDGSGNVGVSVDNYVDQLANVTAQAGIATAKAAEAAGSAAAASTSAGAAAGSAASALSYLRAYRATSYGALAADPVADPNGDPPTTGDEYFNTTDNLLKRFNGATWQASDINTANLAASGGSALVGHVASGGGAVARTTRDKLREWVSLSDFNGADATGATSSVTALQNALSTGKDVVLVGGTWRLDGALAVANNGTQRIIGTCGATLSVNLAASTDLFTISGPLGFENVSFDFNNGRCRNALNYQPNAGHIRLRDLKFQNLKDIDSTTASNLVVIPPTGNTFDIRGVRFSSILKRGNGVITDGAGGVNCIYVGGGAGATQGSIRDVFASAVHNIDVSDAVIYEDSSVVYVITDNTDTANRIAIDNVQGSEFGKRLLKIQASNVAITNVTGYSTEGDSLGVIGFLDGGAGDPKYGNSATNCRAYGKMESAFSGDAYGVKWRNVIAYTTPGTKAGMSNGSYGLLINGDDTDVDGYESGSERHIGIGSSSRIVKNARLKNLKLVFNSTVLIGVQNVSTSTGFDGLTIQGVRAVVDSTTPTSVLPFDLVTYLNGTTKKGRNIALSDIRFESAGPANSSGLYLRYCENVSLRDFRYINTSGATHYRLAIFEDSVNVNVDGVTIEGANTMGVQIKNCTGRNTASRVQNPAATTAAVYNENSANVRVNDCDPTKVTGITTGTIVDGAIRGSVTFDAPSLVDAAGTTTTVTVTGAALGDRADATLSLDLQGITLTAWVSAANTVSVRLQNESGATVDINTATLAAFVYK